MNDRSQLTAYLATLAALVVIVVAALAFGSFSEHVIDKIEAFGIGTVTGGLIGVLRIPQRTAPANDVPQPVTVSNPASDPVPVANQE